MIRAADVPTLPRGVRLWRDRVRDCTVLLGPERVLMIDPIGEAILTRVDGCHSITHISATLAETFCAPQEVIEPDVIAYLSDLADKRLVEMNHD